MVYQLGQEFFILNVHENFLGWLSKVQQANQMVSDAADGKNGSEVHFIIYPRCFGRRWLGYHFLGDPGPGFLDLSYWPV